VLFSTPTSARDSDGIKSAAPPSSLISLLNADLGELDPYGRDRATKAPAKPNDTSGDSVAPMSAYVATISERRGRR